MRWFLVVLTVSFLSIGCNQRSLEEMSDEEIATLLAEDRIFVKEVNHLPEERLFRIGQALLAKACKKAKSVTKNWDKLSGEELLHARPLEVVDALYIMEPLMKGSRFDECFRTVDTSVMRFPKRVRAAVYPWIRYWFEDRPNLMKKLAHYLGIRQKNFWWATCALGERWGVIEGEWIDR